MLNAFLIDAKYFSHNMLFRINAKFYYYNFITFVWMICSNVWLYYDVVIEYIKFIDK